MKTADKILFFTISELNFLRSGILSVSPYCFGVKAMDTSVDIAQNFVFKSVRRF